MGVTLCDTGSPEVSECLFATPLERYDFLLDKAVGRGERLTPEEQGFLTWFRAEYAEMLALAGAGLERAAAKIGDGGVRNGVA